MAKNRLHALNDLITLPAFNPTDEQQRIFDSAVEGKHIVVKAFAGTGKTATAVELATRVKRHGRMVVFNSSARRDAANRMPEYIKVSTGHGMAHDEIIKPSTGFQRKLEYTLNNRRQDLPPKLIQKHLALNDLPELSCTAGQLATAIQQTVNGFLISADRSINERHIPKQCIPLPLRLASDWEKEADFTASVLDGARKIWADMQNERIGFPITHDGYLKLLHLRDIELSLEDNIWLLDEYQDTNPVVDAIISRQPGQKIYIGDPYQQIYGWRGAINAMQGQIRAGLPVMPLSRSFRFNHQIAGAANILLRALGETTPLVGEEYNLKQMNLHLPHTVLVRNNLTMLNVAGEYMERQQPVYLPGNLNMETQIKAQSALALRKNRMDEVRIGALKDLGSWSAFEDAAKTLGDDFPEYKDLIRLVHRHGDRLTDIIQHCQTPWEHMKNRERRVTLMTTHRAKGREWSYIRLTSDLALSDGLVEKLNAGAALTDQEREQVNLLYVAITRCKKSLLLSPTIKQNLRDLDTQYKAMKLDQIEEEKPTLSEEEIRARTAAFIAQHGKRENAKQ
ncbi:UvrD-helicase domain-containing protein [Marinobacter subterrani]|uniref:UvrD-helicase domain-containing protein n=1 Tax=Marinobacter subterrani TaxID=1658765 RepID=UPI0023550DAB|nr:UvrD-helicase domain-containing protein [Marinobacter subterrani]